VFYHRQNHHRLHRERAPRNSRLKNLSQNQGLGPPRRTRWMSPLKV
jgi:hypothetical protein